MNVAAVSAMTQRSQDFEALQSTLQSGNLNGAQRAFAAFQQDVQKTTQMTGPDSMFAPGTQASKDLQALGGALRSANLSSAQQAFSSLLKDIQTSGVQPTTLPFLHPHHPLTPAEVANNGLPVFQAPAAGSHAAQVIGGILNSKA
jgi:hypothetical protein